MALPSPPPIQQLHHYAYRARDAEETRRFYEDILGLPLYHIIQSDHVPSTGEYCPYTHFFFRLQDGSFIAFFDLGDGTPDDDPGATGPSNWRLQCPVLSLAIRGIASISTVYRSAGRSPQGYRLRYSKFITHW